ncbi:MULTISPECIES: HEPN domain-containing protein [unclassified Synechocystis]|uniref:HEPN domain-containing protein n=1 Tax=unclassified Synechocystis TaxID=2640012 RepID=UPI00040C948D|nr:MULTISPECIES: HEPN domain-containing protein [unclassified Synechocystis]AIE73993.1 hypothetical protein, conserved, DUF103 family [Synechocystis sp. PCC 6714]MCT0252554.1 HEPN domain-containing protein [Synechocystis sp. CS-94]
MNKEQHNLLEKASQSLNAAEYLFKGGYNDFAVARAYYTMFYLASAILATEDLRFSKHSAVISFFGKEIIKTGKVPLKFHQYLKKSHDLRNLGDYGMPDAISCEETQTQITNAWEFLKFTQDYLGLNNTE